MKRTKKITASLRAIAKDLPKQNYQYYETVSESGENLIQRNILKDGEGKEIIPNKNYLKKVPCNHLVNHENRLKSAFDSNGIEGVKNYLKPYIKPELRDEFFSKINQILV